jgi:hypothetical protein
MERNCSYLLIFISVSLLGACAFDIVNIKQIPVQIEDGQLSRTPFELKKEANVNLGTGYSRVLRSGTKWSYVGTLQYGDVFKTSDQVLTVEASNIHEAYIVVSSNRLVGFYLPVENSYFPLSESIELDIE